MPLLRIHEFSHLICATETFNTFDAFTPLDQCSVRLAPGSILCVCCSATWQ